MHNDMYPTFWSRIKNFTVLKIFYALTDYSSLFCTSWFFLLLLFEIFNIPGILLLSMWTDLSLNLKLGCYDQQIPVLLAHSAGVTMHITTPRFSHWMLDAIPHSCSTPALTRWAISPDPCLFYKDTIHTLLVFNYTILFILFTSIKAVCPNSIISWVPQTKLGVVQFSLYRKVFSHSAERKSDEETRWFHGNFPAIFRLHGHRHLVGKKFNVRS